MLRPAAAEVERLEVELSEARGRAEESGAMVVEAARSVYDAYRGAHPLCRRRASAIDRTTARAAIRLRSVTSLVVWCGA